MSCYQSNNLVYIRSEAVMGMSFDRYMRDMVQPMRDELTVLGIRELTTPEEVEEQFEAAKGTALVVVNSVCGCAAGQARPGVALALQNEVKPDHLFTVFAGQDKEATAKAREYFAPYPPSSPSIALLKDGELVHFIERHQVENRSAEEIAADLTDAFNRYCQ
jgi:putative YphP/YqiW family bacilliredoxin